MKVEIYLFKVEFSLKMNKFVFILNNVVCGLISTLTEGV